MWDPVSQRVLLAPVIRVCFGGITVRINCAPNRGSSIYTVARCFSENKAHDGNGPSAIALYPLGKRKRLKQMWKQGDGFVSIGREGEEGKSDDVSLHSHFTRSTRPSWGVFLWAF